MIDTAARLAIVARRNEVCRFTIVVVGIDLTGVTMAMQVRPGRDVPGPPLFALGTVNTAAAEGLKLDSVTVTNGVPTSIIKGRINASTMSDAARVPYSGEIGDDTSLAYAMVWTIAGDTQTRLYGDFVMEASAWNSDNAPVDRPQGYGASVRSGRTASGSLQFGDQVVQVTLGDAALLGPLVAKAEGAADEAAAHLASFPDYYVGPPGAGPGDSLLLAGIPNVVVPPEVKQITVVGRAAVGDRGAGRVFVPDPSVTADMVADNPYIFVRDRNGRGFREGGPRPALGFYVEDYQGGNDTLGGADDTETFNRALFYALRAGVARLHVPRGTFNANIAIPPVGEQWIKTIEIVGCAPPSMTFGTIGTLPWTPFGTVLRPADQTKPVIEVQPRAGSNPFSFVKLGVRDLAVSCYNRPKSHGIDARHAQQREIRSVQIDNGLYSADSSEPDVVSVGLWASIVDNGAFDIIRDVVASGFYVGIIPNEHGIVDNAVAACCKVGFQVDDANHAIRFENIGSFRNQIGLQINGSPRLSVGQMRIEHANAASGQTTPENEWQVTTADVLISGGQPKADINYKIVLGNVAGEPDPRVSGGAFLVGGAGSKLGLNINPVGSPRPLSIYDLSAPTQSIPSGVLSPVNLALNIETLLWLQNADDASKFTCYLTGFYRITFDGRFAANPAGTRGLLIYQNGAVAAEALQAAAPGSATQFPISKVIFVEAGDVIQIRAYQDSGGPLDLQKASAGCRLEISRP